MSAIDIPGASDEDVSFKGLVSSVPCDMIDSTYSVLGSPILDEKEGVEEVHKDKEQPEEDDGVDVIDEESVSDDHELQKGLQYLIGTHSGIHPKTYQSTEEQPSTTQMAESSDLAKSPSGSDRTAHKVRLRKIIAHVPLDFKIIMVFFIPGTLLLAGYMQYHIDSVYKSIQDDLEQERNNNELLSLKLESMNTQLKQFQRGELLSLKLESMNTQLQQLQRSGSAAMSVFMKDLIAMQKDLCPVFVDILQIVEFFVHTESHHDVIETCGEVIGRCLDYRIEEIWLFLESDGLPLLESLSYSSEWLMVMKRLFDRRNEVFCSHQIVGQLFKFLDSSVIRRIGMAQYASGILCRCLDNDDLWNSNAEPTKVQVSEAVSRAIRTWEENLIILFGYEHMESMATWVKKSSAPAQQHFAVWNLFSIMDKQPATADQHTGVWSSLSKTFKEFGYKMYIKNAIGEVILKEILKDPRPVPHTKVLIEKILDTLK